MVAKTPTRDECSKLIIKKNTQNEIIDLISTRFDEFTALSIHALPGLNNQMMDRNE